MMAWSPEPGDRFEYDNSNPMLITPVYLAAYGTVVWNDDRNVYYRKDGSAKVEQTSLERFLEIAKYVP